MASALEASGAYRVLRRLQVRQARTIPDGVQLRRGLIVDVETTGLEPARDEIIELAMVPFTYGLDGQVYTVGEPFDRLREPSRPITAEITTLTGISETMVKGHRIDPDEVVAVAAPVDLVIAHNAAFDRKFLERLNEVFTTKPWACSMTQIDWQAEGYEGVKLGYLAASAGFFFDRHRAVQDCLATVELLALPHPGTGLTGLAQLLTRARTPSWRVWAENSPFDLKDQLRARGYRWNGDAVNGPRAWYIDVDEEGREAELAFLKSEIYRGDVDLLVRRIDAYDRFSERG